MVIKKFNRLESCSQLTTKVREKEFLVVHVTGDTTILLHRVERENCPKTLCHEIAFKNQ